jgi:hypothetical protein
MTENIVGIYSLKGIPGKSSVRIKQLDTIFMKEDTKVRDSLVDSFYVMEERKIYVEVFACNVTNYYLLKTKKQPVFSFVIYYYKQLMKTELFRMYLSFDITDDVTSEKELLENDLNGNFVTEIVMAGKSRTLDKQIEIFESNEKVMSIFKAFVKTPTMKSMLITLADESDLKREEKHGVNFSNASPPVVTKSLRNLD